ncbi:MAG TPA: hypothetical protein DGT23_12110 [Micromonosporaceae bacterium]|nr:hypothetical protein [Micromonosporaceae bacterium]
MTDQTHSGVPEKISPDGAVVPHSRGESSQGESELIALEEAPLEEESPQRPRRWWIAGAVFGTLAIVTLATMGPATWRIIAQKDATLTMPAAVGNLTRDDSTEAKETATDLVTALRAEIELDKSEGAIYTDPAVGPGKSVMLFGGTTLLWSPEKELDTVLKLMEDAGDGIKDLKEVDAGPLGGIMKCGGTGTDNSPMAVCGWADHGSIALALFPGRTATDAAVLMQQFRTATQSR